MENTRVFKLLDGIFNAEEARYFILNFYSEKLLHHNRELLYNKIHGKCTAEIEKHIHELEILQNDINQFFVLNQTSNNNLFKINGVLEIMSYPEIGLHIK